MLRGLAILAVGLCGAVAACTIGSFGPGSTIEGRPILWKNRDVSDENQEMRFFTGSRFSYVTNVYAIDTLNAWAGINEAGFGIMNSNSYNIYGKFTPDADDGTIMNLALATCANVYEFSRLLDSLNLIGRETPANYGVFDSTGVAAMFETSNLFYNRYDCAGDSVGFILRANYSMSGSPNRMTGKERYLRAMQLARPARRKDSISVRFIVRTLARDMGSENFDPYPLPFCGYYQSLPFGYIGTGTTICRLPTRSTEIMVGTKPGEPASRAMMWVLLGPPEVSLPIPLWVQGGPVPELLDGPERSRICDEAIRLRGFIRDYPEDEDAVNTIHLKAVLDRFAPVEERLFAMVESAEAAWGANGPTPEQAAQVTAAACDTVLDTYLSFWVKTEREPQPALPDTTVGIGRSVSRKTVLFGIPGTVRPGTAGVYDAAGRCVATFPVVEGQRSIRVRFTGLMTGNYFVVFPRGSSTPPVRFTLVR
jgi:hypothetical protein